MRTAQNLGPGLGTMKGLLVAWGGWSGEEKLLSSCSLVVYNMVKIDFIYFFLPRWGPIKTRDGCNCEVWKILLFNSCPSSRLSEELAALGICCLNLFGLRAGACWQGTANRGERYYWGYLEGKQRAFDFSCVLVCLTLHGSSKDKHTALSVPRPGDTSASPFPSCKNRKEKEKKTIKTKTTNNNNQKPNSHKQASIHSYLPVKLQITKCLWLSL